MLQMTHQSLMEGHPREYTQQHMHDDICIILYFLVYNSTPLYADQAIYTLIWNSQIDRFNRF